VLDTLVKTAKAGDIKAVTLSLLKRQCLINSRFYCAENENNMISIVPKQKLFDLRYCI
jgi:hypothetical protein